MGYPSSIQTFTAKSAGQTIQPAHVNDLQTETTAVETGLLTGLAHDLVPDSTANARGLGSSSKQWGLAYVKAVMLADATELTIASGAITVTQGYHAVDTEGNAAADDLDSITAGSGITAGAKVVFRAEDVSRVVTLKDGTGNLLLNGDCALSATDRTITLIYDGTNWREIARSVHTSPLRANSGTTTSAAAENVDTVAISGLTAKDTLKVVVTWEAVTQQTAAVQLYNATDSVKISECWGGSGTLGAGETGIVEMTIRQVQSAATAIRAVGLAAVNTTGNIEAEGSTFTTNWTGSWTLALRHTGVTAGGTGKWSWAVHKVAGQ